MLTELAHLTYLFAPLVIGAAVHGLFMRFNWMPWLARPVDPGIIWRGRPLIGPNKTWRGIIIVALTSAATFSLQARVLHAFDFFRGLEITDYAAIHPELAGFLLGLGAMLSELPNSILKRRLGIAPGQGASGVREVLFYLLDQVDLLIGSWLALACFIPVTPVRVLLSLVLVTVVHQSLSLVGYLLGIRKTMR